MSVNDRVIAQRNKARHDELCKAINKDLPAFVRVGTYLIELRDLGVYKETHDTFETFVQETFSIERRRAYQLIEAAEVNANLCKILHKTELPIVESQLREVGKAPVEKQAEVVQMAAEIAAAEDRKPTASDYRNAVEVVTSKPKEAEPVEEQEPEPEQNHPERLAAKIISSAHRLDGIVRELTEYSQEIGGEYLELIMQSVQLTCKQLKSDIRATAYCRECESCKGKGCANCRSIGWLSKGAAKSVDGLK
jgi:hypothetical protein